MVMVSVDGGAVMRTGGREDWKQRRGLLSKAVPLWRTPKLGCALVTSQ